MTMPGLPKHPIAEEIDINDTGKISGLFWLFLDCKSKHRSLKTLSGYISINI
jgi:hypothetical protein